MEKSENLKDIDVYKIMAKELKEFASLVKGHRRLLEAIGNL